LVIDFLVNFSRPFIYTTALSALHVKELEEKVIYSDLSQRQLQLQENISYFRAQYKKTGLISTPTSPIQSLHIGDTHLAKLSEQECEKNGIHIKAILAPTVSKGTESLRISIHSFNTRKEIDQLIQLL
jgi:8-amino-7-oxononanoate synthase